MKQDSKNYTQEKFIIPTDILLEIAQIILQADLPHEIVEVKENKGQIVMSISYQINLKFHQEAIKNVNSILQEYHDLCHTERETIDWRDA
jgi:hypothetical protein